MTPNKRKKENVQVNSKIKTNALLRDLNMFKSALSFAIRPSKTVPK